MYGEGNIPVEVAILRELEYRKKVAQMKHIPEAEFCRNFRPLQLLSSIPSPGLGPNQRLPSSHPAPKPPANHESSRGPLPIQAPKPAPGVPMMHQQRSRSKQHESQQPSSGAGRDHDDLHQNHSDHNFCKICHIPCAGYDNYKQHLEGRRHKKRKLELEIGERQRGEVESPRRWCESCKIWCMNDELYQTHLRGRQHKNHQLQMLEVASGKDKALQIVVAKQALHCDVCGIDCPGEESLMSHLKGKRHTVAAQYLRNGGGGTHGGRTGNQLRYGCDLCNIWCPDMHSLEMHRQGKKHIVQEIRSRKA
ncbi:unnamed protein product [Linum trigynum]|uniref:C2H2-type domain-containing protein n=1 Tax=Linum trigynum TaxID=586398 RepID=A0AAV2EZX1_9ROSI